MVTELYLEGDDSIFQLAMPDVPPACIGEEAIAIEYHFDHGRASRRVALSEDPAKLANQQLLDPVQHALSPFSFAETWAWPASTKSSAPAPKLESSEARKSAALAISCGSATPPSGTTDAS
jgi:hypothetical protein